MYISNLKLKNFMNVEECDLAFVRGINVMGGITGSGKSTIFSAIAFCLGGVKRGNTWADFIKSGQKNLSIEMVLYKYVGDEPMMFNFTGDGSANTLVREIRYKEEFSRNAECDVFLSKYFDTDMMENILFHLQDSINITHITPTKRRDVLKKVFNSDFDEIVELIKEDKKAIKENTLLIEGQLSALKSIKYDYREMLPVSSEDTEKLRINKKLLEAEILALNNSRQVILAQYNLAKQSLDMYKASTLTNEITFLEQKNKNNENSIINLTFEIEELEKSLIAIEEERAIVTHTCKASTVVLEERNIDINNYLLTEKDYQKELTENKTVLFTYQKQLKVFDTSPECPTCGSVCTAEHKLDLVEKIDSLTTIVTKLENKVARIASVILSAQVEKKDFEKGVLELTTKVRELEKFSYQKTSNKISKESEIASCRTNLNVDKVRTTKLLADKGILNKNLQEAQIEYDRVSIDYNNSDLVTSTLNSKQKETQELANKISAIENALLINRERQNYNTQLKENEETNTKKIWDISQTLNTKQLDIIDLDAVQKVYEAELPNHIMMKACVLLEQEMNNYLSQTKDNFCIKIEQTAKGIEFFYKARAEPEWIKARMSSGFESCLLTLGFKVSVAQAYDTKFIIFDEVDKSADEEASVRLMEMISNVEGFDQMFITTHRPKALEYLQEQGANIYIADNGTYSNK